MKTLLAIVDDWEALERYEERLGRQFEVHCAPFASTGFEMALELKPDLILIDLVFEDMHGLEALQKLRELGIHAQTLLISDEAMDVASFAHAKFLQRPFTFAKLIETLA